jgi:hypothetical protein
MGDVQGQVSISVNGSNCRKHARTSEIRSDVRAIKSALRGRRKDGKNKSISDRPNLREGIALLDVWFDHELGKVGSLSKTDSLLEGCRDIGRFM